jgi:hypothetical protein
MAAFGIKAIQPQDNEHIFGFATARGTADDSLLEVWNGPTQSDLRFTIDKEGQLQGRDGSAARPTYSFETDKDTGRYLSGAASMLDVVSGTAVGTWTAGKLTLVELQVDNININGNTISSTAGTDLLITPLAGQQIVLDGTIIIDAGVVTGATSITSSSFVGALTGNADSATTATTATNVTASANNSSDETVYPTFVDGATGAQGIETDTGLTYNPSTGVLTATTFTGALTGAASTIVVVDSSDSTAFPAFFDSATGSLAIKTDASGLTYNASTGMLSCNLTGDVTGTASVATTVTITDNESTDEDNALIFTAGGDVDGGNLGLESDGTLTYNPSTGKITATGFIGALTGNADTATVGTNVTASANNSSDETVYPTFVDGATGTQGIETDTGLTYNPSSGILTTTQVTGNLVGNVTGNVTGSSGSCTGNAATATTSTNVTVTDNENASENDLIPFVAGAATATGSHGLEMDGDFHYNPSTGTVTATAFAGVASSATVASTVVVVDSTDTTSFIAMFDDATGSLAAKTDGALKYNAGTGNLESTIITATTSIVPDESDGATLGTASLEWADLFLADGAQIAFGDDQEVTLTHVADTGLLLSDDSGIGTTQLQFGDSASYIAQSSDGVLRIDGEVTIDLNASTAVTVSNDLKLDSDAAVLGFGVDNDVTLTHVADTGLLLNGAMALQFSDASQYINAPSATVLDINATDEIELNATAVDLNGTLDVSGTSTLTGNVSAGADIIIGATDKLRLDGSASGNTYFSESSADVVTLTTEGEDSFHLATGGGNPYIKLNALNTGIGSIQYWEENGSGTSEFKWQASVRGSDNNYYISDQTSGIESNYALMCTGSRAVAIGGDLTAPSASFSGQIDTTNMVGIGTTSPGSYYTTDLVIADTASGHTAGLTIANANDGQGRIDFADGTSGDARYRGTISYNHDSTPANGYMRFVAGGAEALRLGSNYILMANLPTSDPGVANSLYNDSGTLKISAG